MKKIIKLTESDLTRIVQRVISETKVMLRKMTKKSVLGDEGGKYAGWTVGKLLDNDPKKLFYIYTHYEKISFVDEVLDELKEKGYPVRHIDKPGTDKDQYRDHSEGGLSKLIEKLESKSIEDLENYIKAKKINRQFIEPIAYDILRKKKRGELSAYMPTKNVEYKGVMKARNQGKL